MPPNAAPSKPTAAASKQRIVPAIPRALAPKARDKPPQPNSHGEPAEGSKQVVEGAAQPTVVPLRAPSDEQQPIPPELHAPSPPLAPEATTDSHTSKPSPDTVKLESFTAPTAETAPVQEVLKDISNTEHPLDAYTVEPSHPQVAQRRELPPAFVPGQLFGKADTGAEPQSASTGQRESSVRESMHHPRSSTNSLVFGGPADSVDSAQGNTPLGAVPQPVPAPPNGFQGPMPPNVPFYPNGHGYHLSEPPMGPMYGPAYGQYPYAGFPRDPYGPHAGHYPRQRSVHNPQSQRFNQGRRVDDYNYNRHPPMPYQMPPAGPYSGSGRADTNREPVRPFPGSFGQVPGPQQHDIHPHAGLNHPNGPPRDGHGVEFAPPTNSIMPELSKAGIDGGALHEYLLAQFGNIECADFVVHISHSAFTFNPVTLPAHGILLARSPKLRSLMAMQRGDANVPQPFPRNLEVQVSDKLIIDGGAVIRALKYLYGEPLLQLQPTGFDPNLAMQFALSYAAAGHYLELDDIIMRGLDIATQSLRLENVNKALSFALEGGLSLAWSQPDLSGTEDRGSSSSTDDASAKLESPTAAPTYGVYSSRLLQRVVDFLLGTFSANFKFTPSAPQLSEVPRLPNVAEPRHLRTGSRLSQIRFGDLTIGDESEHDRASTTMSSVLLSLPFPVLKFILEHGVMKEAMGAKGVQKLAQQVVEEREIRRERASNNKDGPSAEPGLEERLWHQVYWREGVERSDGSEWRLVRHRISSGTSGSTANSNKF